MGGWVIICPQINHKTLFYIYRIGLWLDILFLQLQRDVANIKDNFSINTQYFMFCRALDRQDCSYPHIVFQSLHHHSHDDQVLSWSSSLTMQWIFFFVSATVILPFSNMSFVCNLCRRWVRRNQERWAWWKHSLFWTRWVQVNNVHFLWYQRDLNHLKTISIFFQFFLWHNLGYDLSQSKLKVWYLLAT